MGVPLNFPVQKLFISLYPAEIKNSVEQYEAQIRMRFENAVYARGAAVIFSLAGNITPDESDVLQTIFFSNPPVVNGSNIDIKTTALSGGEITLLLETFLLYLR
jgi:hypothetical protein